MGLEEKARRAKFMTRLARVLDEYSDTYAVHETPGAIHIVYDAAAATAEDDASPGEDGPPVYYADPEGTVIVDTPGPGTRGWIEDEGGDLHAGAFDEGGEFVLDADAAKALVAGNAAEASERVATATDAEVVKAAQAIEKRKGVLASLAGRLAQLESNADEE